MSNITIQREISLLFFCRCHIRLCNVAHECQNMLLNRAVSAEMQLRCKGYLPSPTLVFLCFLSHKVIKNQDNTSQGDADANEWPGELEVETLPFPL